MRMVSATEQNRVSGETAAKWEGVEEGAQLPFPITTLLPRQQLYRLPATSKA